MEKEKVYCGECKWFAHQFRWVSSWGPDEEFGPELCEHPGNLRDTHLERDGERISAPEKINANNDCKWFEPKEPPNVGV